MLITIKEARKIIGDSNLKYTDKQIQEIIDHLYVLSNLIIDRYIEIKNK